MDLPRELVERLNELGFVLIPADEARTFQRMAISGDVILTVDPLDDDAWRVSIKWRQPIVWGDVPISAIPISLARLGACSDGDTLDLSTHELIEGLPRLMRDCVLPTIDRAPSGE